MTTQKILTAASLAFAVACADTAPSDNAPATERGAAADASASQSRTNMPRMHVEPGTLPSFGSEAPSCSIAASSSAACDRSIARPPAGYTPDGRFAPAGVMARIEVQSEQRQVPRAISELPPLSNRVSPVADSTKGLDKDGGRKGPDLRGLGEPAIGSRCPVSPDGWLNAPEGWPSKQVRVGKRLFDRFEAIRLLDGPEDNGFAELAAQAVAAELNLASGIADGPVVEALAEAHALLAEADDGPRGIKGRCTDEVCEREEEDAFELAEELADFNIDFCG
jgi:hypothetical protein